MRVARQHTDPEHPDHGVAVYRLGRVQDFTHPLTGETTSADDIMVALLDQARAEPDADQYNVWPERLEDDGAEDCYLCAATGKVGRHRLEDNEELVPTETDRDGNTISPWSERDVTETEVAHVVCPNCKGEKQTPKGKWTPIDEDALRRRAAGEPVEVPTVEQIVELTPGTQIHPPVEVAASQPTETTQEG